MTETVYSLPIKTPYKATQALEYNEGSLLWQPKGAFGLSQVHIVSSHICIDV